MSYAVVMPTERTQLIVRLPKALRDCVEAEADRQFRSASAQVAAIVREWCERQASEHTRPPRPA